MLKAGNLVMAGVPAFLMPGFLISGREKDCVCNPGVSEKEKGEELCV